VFDEVLARLQLTRDDHLDEDVVHRFAQWRRTLQWRPDGPAWHIGHGSLPLGNISSASPAQPHLAYSLQDAILRPRTGTWRANGGVAAGRIVLRNSSIDIA
jgi:hypothetical protein